MPLAPPSTPAPAAPVAPAAGSVGPAIAPTSTSQGAAGAAAAPVPISAARAERDAIAAAATAGALRRKGNNPRQLARHIAAALNVDITDPSLFWIAGVTGDGQILVANNYGLAYIPEHVQLPPQVKMVSGDESIPASTRGTWATYPLLALQEWARHHNLTLQAVIGTEANLKGFDLGAARDILTPEDMPDTGKMQGRSSGLWGPLGAAENVATPGMRKQCADTMPDDTATREAMANGFHQKPPPHGDAIPGWPATVKRQSTKARTLTNPVGADRASSCGKEVHVTHCASA
ncbi:hypothetical protein [Arthrobacter sp. SLBN-53]|uniref:hypothetical protein n=1 Tax=Arthrobacter sp. SLBN-53 TaxID=2768412 RepID=UPI00116B1024|nr:hypothetical protein [Arthrobacter sp. SLBN-53]TQK31513.1 hypothetical protein FBY28_4550 [Arthrobacter sp. SLBN-53]